MVANPFKYGVVVTGNCFVDRESEIETLDNELYSGKSIVLYSQRRLGKTSLIMEFISRRGQGIIPVYIDLYGMTTKEELARQIVNGVINATYKRVDRIKDSIETFLSSLRPRLMISTDGNVTVDLGVEKTLKEEELVEILDFPQMMAEKKKKRMLVIFDEFQEIAIMDGVVLEKVMRSRFQHHGNVSYLFAGCKEHILHEMFDEESRAFFKFARPLSLGMISKDEFAPFISERFRLSGGAASDDIIEKILTYTGGHPYFTQYLCHEIWYVTRSPRGKNVMEKALENILAQQSIAYEHIWDQLKSKNQRTLLIGIAREGGNVYSSEFIERYRLQTQSHVEKSKKMLVKKGILDSNGRIIDIFFKEWIIQRLGPK